ncbi:acetyltransferase-like isoleucine patch superfamily enzyme [Bradyrhizobium ottawaense]
MNNSCVPSPMAVSEAMIERCRSEVEGRKKAMIRRAILPLIKWWYGFAELGEGFQLGLKIRPARGSRVGRFAYIGSGFEASDPISIGDLCMISTHVRVAGNDHGTDKIGTPTRLDFRRERKITVFEADSWVGNGAIIRAGVTIGRGAVIGAGAVVTRSVEPYCIVAGAPATLVRKRFNAADEHTHDAVVFGDHLSG